MKGLFSFLFGWMWGKPAYVTPVIQVGGVYEVDLAVEGEFETELQLTGRW